MYNDNWIVKEVSGMTDRLTDDRYAITWLVRRLFRAMAAAADDYLADSGLSAADRAVMEFLYPDERRSVPEIATLYDVSRQHVQVTVNGLLRIGLLVAEDNPRHKRSPLYRLDGSGRAAFAEIRDNETALLERAFRGIGKQDVAATRRTLATLLRRIGDEG